MAMSRTKIVLCTSSGWHSLLNQLRKDASLKSAFCLLHLISFWITLLFRFLSAQLEIVLMEMLICICLARGTRIDHL